MLIQVPVNLMEVVWMSGGSGCEKGRRDKRWSSPCLYEGKKWSITGKHSARVGNPSSDVSSGVCLEKLSIGIVPCHRRRRRAAIAGDRGWPETKWGRSLRWRRVANTRLCTVVDSETTFSSSGRLRARNGKKELQREECREVGRELYAEQLKLLGVRVVSSEKTSCRRRGSWLAGDERGPKSEVASSGQYQIVHGRGFRNNVFFLWQA
ncbi:hypothetical protein L2E82_09114 [Cichorium intybus]|uniref:Uncharacterized protein n=1 Tax=Cichorium intybus TaxID=13427 RepID=A0ACB9G9G5_CICIN|nr:hypothetical protein L2E82_09114 [Cichorium intybus]